MVSIFLRLTITITSAEICARKVELLAYALAFDALLPAVAISKLPACLGCLLQCCPLGRDVAKGIG